MVARYQDVCPRQSALALSTWPAVMKNSPTGRKRIIPRQKTSTVSWIPMMLPSRDLVRFLICIKARPKSAVANNRPNAFGLFVFLFTTRYWPSVESYMVNLVRPGFKKKHLCGWGTLYGSYVTVMLWRTCLQNTPNFSGRGNHFQIFWVFFLLSFQ